MICGIGEASAVIRVVAVSGYKNSGKSTLCRALLAELRKLDIRTGYIKRTSEKALHSRAATDTGAVVNMGFDTVLWGEDGISLESKEKDVSPQHIASRYFPDSELLILEGGKELPLPKIWVRSPGEDIPDCPGVFIVYDRFSDAGDGKRLFCAGDEALIAQRLAALVRGRSYRSSRVYIGDRPLPMKDFIADFIRGSVLGMLASLKGGADPSAPVRVYLDGAGKK